ncbi:MAG: hypothetical protein HYV92_00965 [Candidatus Rokubacteria bacterium]|nr:hypothetical protein [Candidatus Rokubacteria bacterium]MBI2553011.1 hypothetical protein [Candidatus Rokubacteria bacterium]
MRIAVIGAGIKALFGALDRLAPPRAILSTDTSGLSITAIASATGRPERVVAGKGFYDYPPGAHEALIRCSSSPTTSRRPCSSPIPST